MGTQGAATQSIATQSEARQGSLKHLVCPGITLLERRRRIKEHGRGIRGADR